MTYEIGTQWKTRGGWRAVIVQWEDEGSLNAWHEMKSEVMHDDSGNCCEGDKYGANDYDLIEPWKEPREGEVWVNIYETGHGDCQLNQKGADARAENEMAHQERLACVKVKWTEGEGLTQSNAVKRLEN